MSLEYQYEHLMYWYIIGHISIHIEWQSSSIRINPLIHTSWTQKKKKWQNQVTKEHQFVWFLSSFLYFFKSDFSISQFSFHFQTRVHKWIQLVFIFIFFYIHIFLYSIKSNSRQNWNWGKEKENDETSDIMVG